MIVYKRVAGSVLALLLLGAPIIVLWQRQNIYDTYRLHNYQAPTAIAELATQTTMNPLGKKIFYVERPELLAITAFRANCSTSEQTIVLGCYKSSKGIYIYNVQDARLNGVQEVTAAHEMLHAAYDRLSKKEQDHINQLTQQVFTNLTDERIKKNVEAYRSHDPSVVPNELHSIIGTEVKDLPPELETYYSRYFTNRQTIVAYSMQYESEFTSREAAVANFDAQLKSLKTDIDTENAELDTLGKQIDAENARLKSLLAAGDIPTYNSGIPGYHTLITSYNQKLATLKTNISTYNSIVDKRNSIVGEEQSLYNAIDTRVPAARQAQ